MITDISKWKIRDDGTLDTSEGDNILDKIHCEDKAWKKWKKEHKHISQKRKKLTDDDRKQRLKE